MARYYVEKDGMWNIFTTVADGFLYSDFMPFEELQAVVIGEIVVDKMKDLQTLLTSRPRLNTMPYEEAVERARIDSFDVAKEIVHEIIDNSCIAEEAYPGLRQRLHEAVDEMHRKQGGVANEH